MFKKKFTIRAKFSSNAGDARRRSFFMCGVILLFIGCLSGCQTIPALPPVNLSEPGWTTRQGQAVWRPKKDAAEIAGEMLVASHPDGRGFVQFTKTPLPFVVAQTTANSWQIHFVPRNKTYSARGKPPVGLIWFHLPHCLAGAPPPKNWSWQTLEHDGFRLQNRSTGEFLEGYLTP